MTTATRQLLLTAVVLAMVNRTVAMAQTTTREQLQELCGSSSTLAGYDFSEAAVPGMDFRALALQNTKWPGADLRGCRFIGCNLQGANLSEVSARGAIIEDSSLADAIMTGTDLSGALLRGVNLAGASMTNCRLDGALFQEVRLSSNGGTHVPTLTLALRQATGLPLSRAWVNGLSGDAFCFVYNTELPTYWPCRPYYQHPVLGAARLLGVTAALHYDLSPPEAYARLKTAIEQEMACMAPVRLAKPQILDTEQQGVWALIEKISEIEGGDTLDLLLPPLGSVHWTEAQLKMNWAGPWQTLYPAGHPNSTGTYPLVTIAANQPPLSQAAQIVPILKLAGRIVNDPRTYGPLVPGVRGLKQLAKDLQLAGSQQDPEAMRQLGLWSLQPRQCLAGARSEAYQFCLEAAALSGEPDRSMLSQIAAMYETETRMLQEAFPVLVPREAEQVEASEIGRRFIAAAQIIQQVRITELRIAALIETLE